MILVHLKSAFLNFLILNKVGIFVPPRIITRLNYTMVNKYGTIYSKDLLLL